MNESTVDPNCLFCKIVAGDVPSVPLYSDARVFAFKDIHPAAPVHGLVIPKRHIPTLDEFSDEDVGLLGHMMLVARRIAAEHSLAGYRVAMNVNQEGGQVVYHAHLHILGGRQMKQLG
jgi:histidine triad (HIT) family protein